MAINARSTIRDVAAVVSQALADAGITAVLTGGGAVSVYSRLAGIRRARRKPSRRPAGGS
ncbi:MAG: hypothetical protein AMXMBFR45_08750 [Gammaproteobacteria bacterium]|nr:MAG: hypothetical protein BroJett010_14190 [Gammaproteobacteria bacterium]